MRPDQKDPLQTGPFVSAEKRSGGFTLVELLVVIAIIAILAALTLSATLRVQNHASKTTDINNLHQMMIAIHTYTADNNDVMTPPNWDDGKVLSDGKARKGWLYLLDTNFTDTNRFKVDTGLLWPAMRNPKMYFCPMDKPGEIRFSERAGADLPRPQQISSYAMNGAVTGYNFGTKNPDVPPVKLSAFHPTDCLFWETDEADPHNFNDGANNPTEGVSRRHNQGAIQASFDTSVDFIQFDQWYRDVDFSGKNRLWCYPNTTDGGDPDVGHNL